MKLVSLEVKINNLASALNFLRKKAKIEFISHKEYQEPSIFSKTIVGVDIQKFHLILRDNHRSNTDYQFKMNHWIHFMSPLVENTALKKDFVCNIQLEKGEINEITQIDLEVKNLQESKTFFQEKLKMQALGDLEKGTLFGYDQQNPKIRLIENKKLKESNLIFKVQGLEQDIKDPNGNIFEKEEEEDGFVPIIPWEFRKSRIPPWKFLLGFSIVLFTLFKANKKLLRIRIQRYKRNKELD